MLYTIPKNTQAVMGIPIGKLQNLDARVTKLETSGSSTTWYSETPSGVFNGSNAVFTLSRTPASNSLLLFLNGQFQTEGSDYTLSTNTITFTTPPASLYSGLPFIAKYQ